MTDPLFSPVRPTRRELIAGSVALLAAGASAQSTLAPMARKLTLAPMKLALKRDGAESDLLAVDGQSPGPVIRVRRGQPLDLTLENKLDQPTALHIHGLRGVNAAENMPGLGSEPLKPGETRTIRMETPDSGTFIYVPSLQGRVSEQLERGLAGFFIIEEETPPVVDLDLPVALDDVRLDDRGVLVAEHGSLLDSARSGRLGNTLIVNGKPAPERIVSKPGARLRIRLANLANARIMPMRFEGMKATVIAIDGQGCEPFDPLKRTVVLLPGSRYDVILDMPPEDKAEARVVVAIGNGINVLSITSEGEKLAERPPVAQLPANALPGEIRLNVAHRAEFAISGGLPRAADPRTPPPTPEELRRLFPDRAKIWTLNSGFNTGFSGKPVFTVKRGQVVALALVNRTDWPQVITIHGHVFRLLHPLDDGWEPYFLDTIHLPDRTTTRIALDAANPGKWAIRSTIPEHYDSGVASWFEVT